MPFPTASSRARAAGVAALGLALVGPHLVHVPMAVAEESPDPLLLYTFEGDAAAATIVNEGTLGSAFDARVVAAESLPRGTGPTAELGASGRFPGGAQNTSQEGKPYLEIPKGLFDGMEAITVSTWINWNGANANQLPWAYIIGSDALPANNWGVYYQPNEGGQSKAVANSGSEVKAVANEPLASNTWVHLTSVADGESLSYYMNGSLVSKVAVPLDFTKLGEPDSTRSGLIGTVPWAPQWAALFGGEFDDFAVYGAALNAEQVSTLFTDYVGGIASVEDSVFEVSTPASVSPQLPVTASVVTESGFATEAPIAWDQVPPSELATPGNTFEVQGRISGWVEPLVARVTVEERPLQDVVVDFAQNTGAFRGGASGTLYGLGDEQSPTQAIVNGAAMTNVSQKPPYGTQHPGGDAFNIEDTFFDKHGKDLYVYTQDYYPDWPYNRGVRPGDDRNYLRTDGILTGEYTNDPNGVWDYLEVLEIVVDEVAREATNPEKYVFIPFNEVDLQWLNSDSLYDRYMHQGGQPDSYTPNGETDWEAAWNVITGTYAKHGLERPQIAGPGDAAWRGEANIKAFLDMAIETDTVPDIYVWHELRGYQWLPVRAGLFRQYAQELGLTGDEVPEVNITEWGASSDMSSPANLLRWFASFEAAKVDAQTAYWTASGTLSDNYAKVNAGNGGWWLFKWYGDLTGSDTVKVVTGEQNAIAAIDEDARRAQVIVGGLANGNDGGLRLTGLDTGVFGSAVDFEVRENLVSGTDGIAAAPRLVAAGNDVVLTDGQLQLRIPSRNDSSTYQVIITPASDADPEAALAQQSGRYLLEAEQGFLTDAQVRTPSGYRASNNRDVAGFAAVGSRADWTVDVAEAGRYRLQVLGATPGVVAQHALFVDDEFATTVTYGANAIKPSNVATVARGSAEVYVDLEAGEQTLSLRASQDGADLMPGAGEAGGVTLDRFELVRVGDAANTEELTYPASTFRLFEGAGLDGGSAVLTAGQRADVYLSNHESGYYDLTADWEGTDLELRVNGRTAAIFADGESTVTVHLPEGITEVELFSAQGANVSSLSTVRNEAADANIVRIEAEDLDVVELGGTARVAQFSSQLTNGTSAFVQGLGITDANPANEGTLTIPRLAGFDAAGEYDVVIHYSNDDIEGTHDYNPQVVDLGLQASEAGTEGLAGRTTFRYTYGALNFWEAVMPLTLSTDAGAITFGNTRSTLYIDEGTEWGTHDDVILPGYAMAPDVDWLAIAPFVVGGAPAPEPEPSEPEEPSEQPSVEPSPTATVTVTAPAKPGDLYSTPGFHNVNGRWWYTECEPYSQTIRCTTEIWASSVKVEAGRFVQTNGWVFNNLTYLPFMKRAQWANNPLGVAGEWTASDGRRWKTECDTAQTGRDGCRSWVWSSIVASSQGADGVWSHRVTEDWVFNNIVRFKVS
ncbi:hypothetical protein FOJ82_14875 [Tessaracoccus rhinocerotis]|uniref:CBM6 domain-containing protein n=1 Tax=Tessaracoccus rhinocerotis TaxID=1689449 RepID=A0A553JXF9_9ACTN|nr:LamG-like jellyroll fold domain-containing protein [Tessaracoccus rhinocerotis]TRY17124.1 hypothetical protein FOJ82_14875 [Tessaracoccus rhinocerotis]